MHLLHHLHYGNALDYSWFSLPTLVLHLTPDSSISHTVLKRGGDRITDNEHYLKSLQEELAREKARSQALLEEFRVSIVDNKDFTPDDLRQRFRDAMGEAWSKMIYLLSSAESEATQWSVAKYIFNVGLGQVKITDENDPDKKLTDLLESLVKTED